jgi:hypothetical protein
MFNKKLHRFQTIAFNFIVALSWILYISITLGLTFAAPQYLNYLNSFVRIYVSLFLIYRFNPFRQIKLTNLDAKIAFSAGVFILGTTTINGFVTNYLHNFFQKNTKKIELQKET